MEYLRRIIDDELDDLFSQVPAIAIAGTWEKRSSNSSSMMRRRYSIAESYSSHGMNQTDSRTGIDQIARTHACTCDEARGSDDHAVIGMSGRSHRSGSGTAYGHARRPVPTLSLIHI